MNKVLLNELKKVAVAQIDFNESTKELFIPKTLKFSNKTLKKGKVYRISLELFVTNPSESSILASNWNRGIVPKYDDYLVEVVDKLGNMVQVNGVAVADPTSNFYGWLPDDSFEVTDQI